MIAMEIKGLKKVYKKKIIALESLDLSVPESCIFGLVGPNGAGKSTLINILAGIVQKDSGEVSVLGERVHDFDFQYKKNVGFVLEKPVYIEKLTAMEYLEFAAAMYGINKDGAKMRVEELLQFFVLQEKRNELIETFSTGMKKKVSLATAIIHRPKLLILDEPLEGIDPVSARIIKNNLRLMADKGITIFLSSHALDTVEKLCDEVTILNKGKVVFQARTEDVRKKIKDEVSHETYASLEEIFIDVVSENDGQEKQQKLSWL